jgi:hypothetical protein
MRRRLDDRALESIDRRDRENAAPRLLEVVPRLETLRLHVREHRSGDASSAETRWTRQVVVTSAPAMFLVPCTDPSCRRGGHDLTAAVLRQLRDGASEFEGEDACGGANRISDCRRVLRWTASAAYAD